MFIKSDTGLYFEVTFRGKEEFGIRYDEIHGKAWILADSDKDIIFDVKCFNIDEIVQQPELLVELYVDGVLRNVIKPRTGRGLAESQFAEAMIDRGVILSEKGMPLLKRFRFTDLDIDDAVLKSRLVEEAGTIEVRIIEAGPSFNEPDDIAFQLPNFVNDRGTVSLLCGEVNNTVGIRFDEGNESIRDSKEISLQTSIDLMVDRQNRMLGATLAIFSFQYGSDAILLHLGMIPFGHVRYDEEIASERMEVRTRYNAKLSKLLVDKAVLDSDYSLTAKIGELDLLTDNPPIVDVPIIGLGVVPPTRERSIVGTGRVMRKKDKPLLATPQKKINALQMLLTPPPTPNVERTVVYDMTQEDEEVVEIMCIDQI